MKTKTQSKTYYTRTVLSFMAAFFNWYFSTACLLEMADNPKLDIQQTKVLSLLLFPLNVRDESR